MLHLCVVRACPLHRPPIRPPITDHQRPAHHSEPHCAAFVCAGRAAAAAAPLLPAAAPSRVSNNYQFCKRVWIFCAPLFTYLFFGLRHSAAICLANSAYACCVLRLPSKLWPRELALGSCQMKNPSSTQLIKIYVQAEGKCNAIN